VSWQPRDIVSLDSVAKPPDDGCVATSETQVSHVTGHRRGTSETDSLSVLRVIAAIARVEVCVSVQASEPSSVCFAIEVMRPDRVAAQTQEVWER
jgi:hypothetical protein